MQRRKSYDLISFKALDSGAPEGSFEAVVAVFGNIDFQGDRVIKGAFSKSIGEWRASGDPVPVIWSHDWADPFAHIGSVDPNEMEETEKGLKVVGQLDVEKPFARQVFDLLKTRRVRQWSFAYDIIKERPARDRANELQEVKILEVGPTLSGANAETDTLAVKGMLEDAALGAKAGRVLSAKNESALRQARDLLDGVLAVLAEPESDEKAAAKPWTIEERDGEFCVVAQDGETVDCHPTRGEAEAQVRALYASEKASPKADELEEKGRETEQGRAERQAFKERLENLAVGL